MLTQNDMSSLSLTFPNGAVKEFSSGTTGMEVAKSISPGLAKKAVAIKVAGLVKDLNQPLEGSGAIQILTFDDAEGKQVFWHSTSHIMAQAVVELMPQVKLAIGPSIEEGFYYDFEVPQPFSPEDLAAIEKKMSEIASENAPFVRHVAARADLLKWYRELNATYKIDLLENTILDDTVTFYTQSRFKDLCRGPHLPHTGFVKALKLTASSGAYWHGDEKNAMLQRIYGVSYPDKAQLDEYVHRMEEAKRRDHRTLGKQLSLFAISEDVGPGLILWLPKGARVRNEIENFWREEHLKAGYDLVYSPHVANLELWNTSGHTQFYRENMFAPMVLDNVSYQIKPMNCPFHIAMYRTKRFSYRDLPLRYAELGTVYRYERAGVLHGLLRVRGFTQDDAHHFVRPEQMQDELVWLIDFCMHILRSFGFSNIEVCLSTRPEKAIGAQSDWENAENGLRSALDKSGIAYTVDAGGGAFYGPKIDIMIKDAIGRRWQCSTIQFDFSLPERFDLTYVDADGAQKRPIMIHRALLGSIERFFGVLLESFAGDFPLWLAPIQARVMPITDAFNEYGAKVVSVLKDAEIRAEIDDRSEKIGHKIREGELEKIPYMLVVGAKEVAANSVAVRHRGDGDVGTLDMDTVVKKLLAEILSKGLACEK